MSGFTFRIGTTAVFFHQHVEFRDKFLALKGGQGTFLLSQEKKSAISLASSTLKIPLFLSKEAIVRTPVREEGFQCLQW
jgi:hypothetical protein